MPHATTKNSSNSSNKSGNRMMSGARSGNGQFLHHQRVSTPDRYSSPAPMLIPTLKDEPAHSNMMEVTMVQSEQLPFLPLSPFTDTSHTPRLAPRLSRRQYSNHPARLDGNEVSGMMLPPLSNGEDRAWAFLQPRAQRSSRIAPERSLFQ